MADIDFQNGFINGFVAGSTNIEVDMVNRRDTEANWQSINPIIANGEQIIVDTDEGIKIKIGVGDKHFNELEYIDKPITDALSQKADKSELNNINAAQLNGKTANDFEVAGAENRAKSYADEAANKVKDDLTNHSAEAYETLKQLGELIDDNKDALEALNTVATGKADKVHPHEISDVNGLSAKIGIIEEELDGKADLAEIQPIVVNSIRAEAGSNIGTVGTPSVSSRVDGDDVVFTFDYLKGVKGDKGEKGEKGNPGVSATHSWNGTTLSVTSASGTSSANLKGEKGDKGDNGTSATHSWNGTTLTMSSASGTSSANLKGDKGDNGVSVSKIEQTTTSNADGGENIITATLSNGTTSKFKIKNGSRGGDGPIGQTGPQGVGISKVQQTVTSTADDGNNEITVTLTNGTSSKFYVQNGSKGLTGGPGATGTRGSMWFSGTGITGTSSTAAIFTNSGVSSANANDYFLNISTGYVYKCTVAGAASVAKWMYVGSIKGAAGSTGPKGDKGDPGTNGTTPTIKAANGTNINVVGTPSVTASTSGTTTTFTFNNLKGAKGDKGDTGSNVIAYAECSTAASTNAKVASIVAGTFSLTKGARVTVKFTNANSASNATLNINSTGAKTIRYGNSSLTSSQYWIAGQALEFVYDGTYWCLVGIAKDNNTTYSLGSFGVTATASELNHLDGIKSTVNELNYLHKETTTKTGIDLLTRPYDYILEDEGMFAASKNTLLGFVKGNTYTLEVVMNGETMTMTGTAVDGQSETGIAGSIMVEFDGILFFDGAHWNEDFDFVAGGSLWYYFPDGVGVTKYLLTGQGANGALTTVVDVYNKIPEGNLPELVLKTPIVQEFIIDEPYPYTVTGSFSIDKNAFFSADPYESNGIIFNAEDVNATNRTFSVYADNASGNSVKVGTFTSSTSWVPEEGKGLGFMPTDAGGVFKVREIDNGFYHSRVDYYCFARPKGYNRCHVEVSMTRPQSPVDGCEWHFRRDALETISLLDVSDPYYNDSVFFNDHTEAYGGGEFKYEYSTTSRVYSFQQNMSIDIYIDKHCITSWYWGNIEPIACANLSDGEISCTANSYRVSHLDSYDTNMQTDIPLYLVFIIPLINGTNIRATWYSD